MIKILYTIGWIDRDKDEMVRSKNDLPMRIRERLYVINGDRYLF